MASESEHLSTVAEHVIRVLEQIAPNVDAAGLANEAYLLRVAVRALKSALGGSTRHTDPPDPTTEENEP